MRTLAAAVLFALAITVAGSLAQTPSWSGCCGYRTWPQTGGMMGGGMMGGGMMGGGYRGGSMARHHTAMMGGVPAPYDKLENPLPRTSATVDRGAAVYGAACAACHGATGLGDGAAAANLTPRPANLAWLSGMPMSRWDGFMYWTIAEGGASFGTAMPSFKATLPKADIWAVIAYIQARLPQQKAAR